MSSIRPVYGRGWAMSCGHSLAAAAGCEAMGRGGNVVDAALAAATVLTVALPQASTIGGDAFILYHDAKANKTFGVNASGRSPAKAPATPLTAAQIERGPLSCATPGMIGGWETLHRRFGKMPWAQLFTRAIELAGGGFPASPGLAGATAAHRPMLEQDPGATELFLKNTIKAGALFRQPALAETLRLVADRGADGFYNGSPAAAIGRYIQSRGGTLAAGDFAACRPDWVEPLTIGYRGLDVRVMPPNSYGLYMLLQLAALSDVDFAAVKVNAPERYVALIAAAKAAFAAGDRCVADPAVVGDGTPAALSPDALAAMRQDFRHRAGKAPPNRGGTTVISAVDEHGNGVAIVQSVFMVYGAAVADPETGILLNDRMLGFTLQPDHPNTYAPAKRPAHTLNPAMTFDGNGLRHVLLSPGGPGQTLTLTQILQAMVEHQVPLHEAVALPRWSMDLAGDVLMEDDLPPAVFDGVRAAGIPAGRGAAGSMFFGSAECVERLPGGGVVAVADSRREAHAIAI